MSRRFSNNDDNAIDCAHLIPSAIVCLCGDRFDNDNDASSSALWLYLAHKASALASLSTIIKPHRVVCTLVSCVLCTQSIGVHHYRAHLEQCRRGGEQLGKYRQKASPFFSCAACLDDDRFHHIDANTIPEHQHGSDSPCIELYVTCRVCASDVAVDNALEHAAFAHRERLECMTDVADMFVTAPRIRSLERSADSDSVNTYSPIGNEETPGVAPDYHYQMQGVHHRSLTSKLEMRSAKCEPSADSLDFDDRERATFDLPNNHYLAEQIFSEHLVDALCEIAGEPTSAPIETGIPFEVAMKCPRQTNPTAWPSETVRKHLFECDECGQGFDARLGLTIHQRKHMGEQLKKEVLPHECDNCGRRCKTTRDLQLHGKEHTIESASARKLVFECDECGVTFPRGDSLRRHQRNHNARRPFACSDCNKCFGDSSTLMIHRRVHTGERPFACTDCGKRFANSWHLKRHRLVHSGEGPFACTDCGKRFTQSGALKAHRFVHTGKSPFACTDCGKRFANSWDLKRHRLVHTGERPFACTDCGKRFGQSGNLKKHRVIHTGEKPFACSDCDKCFTESSNLERHRRVHTGEKPFACFDCDKCFADSSCLIKHRRVHTGVRPFACSDCGKRFGRSGYLKKHRRVHTSEGRPQR